MFYRHGQSGCCSTASSSLILHPNSSACLRARHADSDFPSDSCCTFVDAGALFYILILISISTIVSMLRKLSTLLEDAHDMNVMFDIFRIQSVALWEFYRHISPSCISVVNNIKGSSNTTGKQTRLITFKKCCFVFGLHEMRGELGRFNFWKASVIRHPCLGFA